MEISGKKSIQAIIEDKALHKHIKTIYLFKTQEYLINLCIQHRVPYELKSKDFFDTNYSNKAKYKYKYAIAILRSVPTYTLEQLIKMGGGGQIVVLDHIHDPFNLGAILRTCSAAGVKGVVLPKNKQAPINHSAVLKASQGYALKTHVAMVTNLHQAILTLKKHEYLIYATALDKNAKNFKEVNYPKNSVLILGNEGKGVSDLLKRTSDTLIYIPMKGNVDSLNVSVAAGIILFEMNKF